MTNWQPIETAPTDIPFLAYDCKDDTMYKCEFLFKDQYGKIHYKNHRGQPVRYPPTPTHWVVLPVPPNGEESASTRSKGRLFPNMPSISAELVQAIDKDIDGACLEDKITNYLNSVSMFKNVVSNSVLFKDPRNGDYYLIPEGITLPPHNHT